MKMYSKEKGNTKRMDDVLNDLGEFGRFQKILVAMLVIIFFPSVYQVMLMYFSTITPSWKCNTNSTICLENETLPADDTYRCSLSRSEWHYTEARTFSIVTQFEIDCEKGWQLNLISCMIFIGWAVGGVLLGWLGDQYGRRVILVPTFATMIVSGFILPFLPNIYLIILFQFIIGFCIPGVQLQAFILVSEFVGSTYRPFACFLLVVFNPVGWCLQALQAYLINDWKILSIVCTAPYAICILFIKFIPESVKWLHLHGKTDEVKTVITRISYWNKKSFDLSTDILVPKDPVTKSTPADLFRGRTVAAQSLIQGFLWYSTVTCYFGIHLAANDLGGTLYRDFALLNLCETPGLALAPYICTRFGRKRATLIPLSIGCITCLIISFLHTKASMRIERVVIGIIGDIAMSMAFFGIYQWSVELYPLRIRNQGMGFLQVVSHGGSAVVPWIVKGLRNFGKWCPFAVLGGTTFLACIMSLWLPETKPKDIDINKEREHSDNVMSVVKNENITA